MYPDPQRRRLQFPELAQQQPVTAANFGSAPQLPPLAPPPQQSQEPPPGINVAQLQGIGIGVMDKFFKPKGVGGVGGKLKGVL